MELFALFLPQFHEIPENDEWWGKGFTEWRNVRGAKPLFKGHLQPRHPFEDNYYNLMNKDTVVWQTSLLKDYGIDGLIYYHYYFNGRKLLERPAENLLKWTEIDQPFFFNWANHSWNRSWKGSTEVLMEQTYGNEDDWKRHFEYLLPFFQDKRYKKINNKPVFMIYNPSFPEKIAMFSCFNEWCKEKGFDGIFVIDECFSPYTTEWKRFFADRDNISQKMYLTLPLAGRSIVTHEKSKITQLKHKIINKLNQKGIIRTLIKYEGNDLLRAVMNEKYHDEAIIPGLFFEWDNTPRHGNRGYIINPISEDVFLEYMEYYKDSDMMIVNAWNEWCEGMMLEPTKENGYRYLEWIKKWKVDAIKS